jgi:hypothetical protein
MPSDYPDTLKTSLLAEEVKLYPLKDEEGKVVPDQFRVSIVWGGVERIARFTLTRTATQATAESWEESVLGADDKLGCYIMCEMIRASIPGLYIFHVGEECGAHGSNHILTNTPDLIKPMKRAVAFDRKGYTDVIVSQGSNTASAEFTKELASKLNAFCPPFQQFKGDVAGVFTDTKVYASVIPECTNISVGYFQQHFHYEHFDIYWLLDHLLPAVLRVKWEELGTHRTPKEAYTPPSHGDWYGSYQGSSSVWVDPMEEKAFEDRFKGWTITKLNAINKATPLRDIPVWVPGDTYLTGVSPPAMKCLVDKWLFGRPRSDIADAVCGILVELEEAHLWLMKYEEKYPELCAGQDEEASEVHTDAPS